MAFKIRWPYFLFTPVLAVPLGDDWLVEARVDRREAQV